MPKGSLERQLQVAAFALSFCTGNTRASKPCPPMLGETFEMLDKDRRYMYLCQEVMHSCRAQGALLGSCSRCNSVGVLPGVFLTAQDVSFESCLHRDDRQR